MILCINAVTGGITEWDLDWLGVAEHGGVIHGMTAEARTQIGGESTEVLSGRIRTGEMDFGTPREKRMPKAYAELELESDATLTTGVATRGETTDTSYTIPVRATEATDNGAYRRRDLARGAEGQWWALELAGPSWTLGALEARVEIVSRRY